MAAARLPILRTWSLSAQYLMASWRAVMQRSLLPFVVLVALESLGSFAFGDGSEQKMFMSVYHLISSLAFLIALVPSAVFIHRSISHQVSIDQKFELNFRRAEQSYFLSAIKIFGCTLCLSIIIFMPIVVSDIVNSVIQLPSSIYAAFLYPTVTALLALSVVAITRCSLILPASALGHRNDLASGWRVSQGNAVRLVAAVCAPTALLNAGLSALASVVPDVGAGSFGFPGTLLAFAWSAGLAILSTVIGLVPLTLAYLHLIEPTSDEAAQAY